MAVALDVCKDAGEAEALVFDTLGDTVHQIESLVNSKALFSWMCRLLVGIWRLCIFALMCRESKGFGLILR